MLAGKRDARLPSLNQVEPSVCVAFLGSGILNCPVTYRASYPPFLGLDVEIPSFTYLQRGRDKTWRDMRPRAPCLPSIGETIVGTVRFGIALGIAFEVPTSISRSPLRRDFSKCSAYMKNWFAKGRICGISFVLREDRFASANDTWVMRGLCEPSRL